MPRKTLGPGRSASDHPYPLPSPTDALELLQKNMGPNAYIATDLARLSLLISKENSRINSILGDYSVEEAGKRLFELINNTDFNLENGFNSFFPKMPPKTIVRIIRDLIGVEEQERKRCIVLSRGYWDSLSFNSSASIFNAVIPDFQLQKDGTLFIPYVENCSALALHLAKSFSGSNFTLVFWVSSTEQMGIMRALFHDLKNVKLERASLYETALPEYDHALCFLPVGKGRGVPGVGAMSDAGERVSKKEVAESILKLLRVGKGSSNTVLVPELFFYSHGDIEFIRDTLVRDNLLTRIVRFRPGGLFSLVHGKVSLIEFSNSDRGPDKDIEVIYVKHRKQRRWIIMDDMDLIRETKSIPAKRLLEGRIWDLDSLFAEQTFSFAEWVETDMLGGVAGDIFRGPSMGQARREGSPKTESVRIVTTSMLEGVIDVRRIEPTTVSLARPLTRYFLKDYDILITCRGSTLRVSIADMSTETEAIPSDNIAVIRVKKSEIDPYYLYIFLKSPAGMQALSARQSGAIQLVLSVRDLKTIEIPLLPLDEQMRVADEYREAHRWVSREREKIEREFTERLDRIHQKMGLDLSQEAQN